MERSLSVAGSIFLLSGSILYGMVFLAIANYVPQMTGWTDPPGKFSLALDATALRAPYIISILFMIIGVLLLATGIIMSFRKMSR